MSLYVVTASRRDRVAASARGYETPALSEGAECGIRPNFGKLVLARVHLGSHGCPFWDGSACSLFAAGASVALGLRRRPLLKDRWMCR
ncbi:hypothetical protein GCM10022399_42420 [Terrabacter ginsenosidimutans]|uniref:Uncharacterized protein n=1 Tax=Terrabacter ginsenosidimutans TaxID=490575 RepID=A0ABP7EN34_9MICO